MRRNEFEILDNEEIDRFLNEQNSGILSLGMSGKEAFPYSVPVNFVYNDKAIIFHSSLFGKKAEYFRDGMKVQFTTYKEYSVIPSYFFEKGSPCFASQFFKSVMAFGELHLLMDVDDKIAALHHLMKKLQPEGNYAALDPVNDAEILSKMIVGKLDCCAITGKFKFGQHLTDDAIQTIIEKLRARGSEMDYETANMILKLRKPIN